MTDLQDPYGVDDEQTSSPMSGRGFILSAALIVLVVLAGIVVVTLNLVDDDEPSTDPTPAPSTPASTSAPADPEASVCGLDTVDLNGTLPAAPTDVAWEIDGTRALPSSEANGPGVREDNGVRYCYSRTPEGALLAATHIGGATGLPPADRPMSEDDGRQWIERTTASGPGYEAALREWPKKWVGLTRDDLQEVGGRAQYRGYRMVTYDGSTALVELVALVTLDGSGEASLRVTRWELIWEKGDWRARLAPDGTYPKSTSVPDLTGYVPWEGA